jgi:hypothetical protein
MPKHIEAQPADVVNLNHRRVKKGLPYYEGKLDLNDHKDEGLSYLPYSERVKQRQRGNEKIPKWMIAMGLIAVTAFSGSILANKSKESVSSEYDIPSATGHKLYRTLNQGERHGKTILATVDGIAGYIHVENPDVSRADAQAFIEKENSQDQAEAGIPKDNIQPDTLQPGQEIRLPMEFSVGKVVNPDL